MDGTLHLISQKWLDPKRGRERMDEKNSSLFLDERRII